MPFKDPPRALQTHQGAAEELEGSVQRLRLEPPQNRSRMDQNKWKIWG